MASLFFAYSHTDSEFRDQLEKHLSMLKRQGRIEAWHDRKIVAGDPFDDRISERLGSADIILLLVSADFLNSDYCYGVEVKRAMERARLREARVIPVILRPCDWENAPFGRLLAAPTDGKAVSKWPDRDEAWLNVVKAIKAALPPEQVEDKTGQQSNAPEARRPRGEPAPPRSGPRSSNLRTRKEFSDSDRARFLKDSFEYMASFFENSLGELKERNPDIETDFTRVDAQQFTAVVYRKGKTVGQCRVRLNASTRGFGSGITFSHDISDHSHSFNENLSVETDDQSLFLRPLGMGIASGSSREAHFSQDGGAELFWGMLIERLQ